MTRTAVAVLCLLVACPAWAQDSAVMKAVRAAVAPALPFPDSDRDGALPVDGNTEALWMVMPVQPGDSTIEVVANPLNQVNQVRAARAMAQIEANVEAAQRRAEAQYNRAIADAKRTGKSQDVDGVTLADEGVAGAKIDADSHVTIEVAFNQPSYHYDIASGTVPRPIPAVEIDAVVTAGTVVTVASNSFRDVETATERYCEAQSIVFLGRVSEPVMRKRATSSVHEIHATALPPEGGRAGSLVIRIRGNGVLIADLLSKTNWNALLELLK
ncbi:MAG: hypothetical protein ABI983_03840 [Acidobacteriota bacterium]